VPFVGLQSEKPARVLERHVPFRAPTLDEYIAGLEPVAKYLPSEPIRIPRIGGM
jgi:hypothetical protein